jgi:hypothetical protein
MVKVACDLDPLGDVLFAWQSRQVGIAYANSLKVRALIIHEMQTVLRT